MDMKNSALQDKLKAEAESYGGLTLIGDTQKKGYKLYRLEECEHEQPIRVISVRKKLQFTCEQCFEDKINAEAETANLLLCGTTKRKGCRLYKFLECGHYQELMIHNVRNLEFECQQCVENERISSADSIGLLLRGHSKMLRGHSKKKGTRVYQFKECKHYQQLQIHNVRNGEFKCIQCFEDRLITEADEADLTLIGNGETSAYRRYKCNKCGHSQEFQTVAVQKRE